MNVRMEKQYINSRKKGKGESYVLQTPAQDIRTIFVEAIYKEVLDAKAAIIEGSLIDQKFGKELKGMGNGRTGSSMSPRIKELYGVGAPSSQDCKTYQWAKARRLQNCTSENWMSDNQAIPTQVTDSLNLDGSLEIIS